MRSYVNWQTLGRDNRIVDWFVGDPAPRRDEFEDTDWRRGYDLPDDPYGNSDYIER